MKRAVVFGGSGTIGKSVVYKFLQAGWSVSASYRKHKRVPEKCALEKAHWFEYDAGAGDDYTWRTDVDAMVYCIGSNNPCAFPGSKPEDFEYQLLLSVIEPHRLICRFSETMVRNIILISSYSGVVGGPKTAHYAAGKGGMIQVMKCAARYYAEYGICINCIAPSYVEGPMTNMDDPLIKETIDSIPAGRLCVPQDVADLVFFLAQKNEYITGQTIHVNGGLWM